MWNRKIKSLAALYGKDTRAVAAMESAFIFPVMMVMLFGVIDIGTAVVINTKVISASQMASDLLTRKNTASSADIAEARLAAEAAMIPYYNADNFGIDLAGVRFVGEDAVPEEQWRETVGMTANTAAVEEAAGLGAEGEGVMIVTVEYRYEPRFAEFLTGEVVMQEVSFARGRDSSYIGRK